MAAIKFIVGEKINLCIIDPEIHFDNCLTWINDPEVNKWLLAGTFPVNAKQQREWLESLGSKENLVLAIVTKTGKYIGNVGLHKIDYISRMAELGIIIGDKEEWGKGIASEAERLILDYAFKNLNLQKISANIFSDNIGSQKAALKNAAVIEGTLKKHIYKNAKYNDLICLAFFKN